MNQTHFLSHFFLSIILIIATGYSAYATHLRAGEITVERVSCSSLTFRITVTVFTNTINTNVLFGGEDDWLEFGDGKRMLIPEQENIPRPDLGEGIATASFTIPHTYSGNGGYVISYSEPNRNMGVVNMDGSVNTRFYIETLIIIDPFLGCNNSPKLLVPPIDRACIGIAWFHNPGAYDPDGDSLSYELVIPFRDRNTTVVNYKDPADPKFYTNFPEGNEEGDEPPSFTINPVDGTLTWDSPGAIGEYNIAFVIREWRLINDVWISIGFVRRDMQIIVDDCDNERPELEVPEDVCVVAGSTVNETIFGTDPDGDSVKIEAFSEIFNFAAAQFPATYTPFPARFIRQPAELQFQWKTDCSHIKDQPYQVVFKITDRSPTGSRLVTFKTWFIKVVGPEPEWVSATAALTTRSANLQWEPYVCENAETIQIWRRVDSFAFEPDSCQTGMPENLGYTLINTIQALDVNNNPVTTYNDNNGGQGLASGAQYCYRLVAIFPHPKGGESYVSEEICLDPILADKAIITNVTVDRTNNTDGEITVKWVAPFEADPGQFPPPYTYQVARAEGFAGDGNLVLVTNTAGLSFTDSGLDTEQKVYNYRITAVASNGVLLDPSATASSVRLEADSQLDRIQLTWSAFVPWSNQIQTVPNEHLIFRGPENSTDDELVLIGSVDVSISGFLYVDEGPLESSSFYCYKVMTRGAYGNPQIGEPLINFSQVICAQPGDDEPPCTPQTPVPDQPIDCIAYSSALETCNTNIFSNTLRWARPEDPLCRNDISYYKVWVAASSSATFTELPVEVRDTFYVDVNLPSFARCYKIQAVDRSGNESEPSEPFCFDNCPYYELPNIFTPNDDGCNDRFSAYSDRNFSDENAGGLCSVTPPASQAKCARFVERVFVRIYNRWGKEVYSYESGGERTIYVDWDGRDADGRELSSGVYYYVADVTFDSVDPEKRNQFIKGWVQLMR
ncbi:MAG: gliding motility-associated C-terminal domain-containing protein [Cyclobacteriaceae bacterium]